jgi:hypothetical protein
LNAKLHVELFNHACSSKCPIALTTYHGTDANLKQLIIDHKCAYYHDINYCGANPVYQSQAGFRGRGRGRGRGREYESRRRDDVAPQRRERLSVTRGHIDDVCHEIDISDAMSQGQAMHKELTKECVKAADSKK